MTTYLAVLGRGQKGHRDYRTNMPKKHNQPMAGLSIKLNALLSIFIFQPSLPLGKVLDNVFKFTAQPRQIARQIDRFPVVISDL